MNVKPKKQLGQHFLTDLRIAERIVRTLEQHLSTTTVLEIGAGTGVLTQYLVQNSHYRTFALDVDAESIRYLQTHYPQLGARIVHDDFLEMNLHALLADAPFSIIGNFPYNISSQIFFKILAYKQQVREVVAMLQKEVARRFAAVPGNKEYGILSVLLQAYYDIKYEFGVPPGVFNPPPKVDSGVISLRRNAVIALPCDEMLFVRVVKAGFNQRRKTLRNALRVLGIEYTPSLEPWLGKRAEQLSVADFVALTQALAQVK